MDIIPNFWTYKNPISAKKSVLMFIPMFGPTQTRSVGDGSPVHNWELSNDDLSHEDFLAIYAFWNSHYPGVSIELHDPQLSVKRVYQIDSDFNFHYNGADSYSVNFRIQEVYPYTETPI